MSQNSNTVSDSTPKITPEAAPDTPPRLDLAPTLSRPLSLWNPLDYLRLLYWAFFFPQALQWYIDTFGGNSLDEAETWREAWERLRTNCIERQLILQALTLIIVLPMLGNLLFDQVDFAINWVRVAKHMALSVMWSLASGVMFGVRSGVAWGVVFGVGAGMVSGMASDVEWSLATCVAFGVGSGVAFRVPIDVAISVRFGMAMGVLLGVVSGVTSGMTEGVPVGVTFCMMLGMAAGGAIARPEDWLFALLFTMLLRRNKNRYFPHVTRLPLPYLSSEIENWLMQDWEKGLYNINQLSRFTFQSISFPQILNQVLYNIPPELLIYRIARLADEFYTFENIFKTLFGSDSQSEMRLDTPVHPAVAGFWYLYMQKPEKAIEKFAVVRDFPYGKEMFNLAQILSAFDQVSEPAEITTLNLSFSPNQPCLHLPVWEAIAALQRVVSDVQTVQKSASKLSRSQALNRALGELKDILDGAENIPQAERKLIINIAKNWQKSLLAITGDIGNISIIEPVINPYIIGDPVQTKLFVGREDIMRELKELWVVSHRLQSVVLYGHRRMGKTSILLNVGNILGAKVHLAYINLLLVGQSNQGVGEVLIKISDAISLAVNLPSPADEDFLKLPYITFERYLQQVVTNLDGGLIIALDEFEKIEELIEAKKIDPDFMGFLRGLVQMSPKIAFAFAGLHTLEEMTEDYFHPFFASIIAIRVGFLSPGATRQILANPDDDFLLDYKPEAMDTIYELTQGQPYLVQLIGFLLVRHYNDLVFEEGKPREPFFTRDDVETVINDPDFFIKGRYYFTGVWGQAAQGARGQPEILKTLAPYREGLNFDRVMESTNLDKTTLNNAIKTLKRHDVIRETNGLYYIIVELFRRWVLENKIPRLG